MRKKIESKLVFIAFFASPALAFADAGVLQSAGNGPWIMLAAVGMVRVVVGFTNGSLHDD